jgi:indolepyruvate ferredoxin oxidoreductase beta subunit
MTETRERPTTLLIAAMGGEGGGVLADWIIAAAKAEGLAVQSTSIPGVAQRTGATTYYIEMSRVESGDVSRDRPVMSLYPVPGNVDVMVASELLEAGRAMQNGFVTPECTTLIASSHRVYSIAERGAIADERFEGQRVLDASAELAKQRYIFDMMTLAQDHGSVINSVLMGAIAGAGCLPIPVARFSAAIEAHGVAVASSQAAFRAGMEAAQAEREIALPSDGDAKRDWLPPATGADSLLQRATNDFPQGCGQILREGVNRLIDYQDAAYAGLYLDRLDKINQAEKAAGGDGDLTRDTAQRLAVWMSYEDVVRVAQAKTRPERLARIRKEVGAQDDEPVRVYDFLKPGVEEFCALLPSFLARPILSMADRRGWHEKVNIGMRIKTMSMSGYLLMRTLASLRWLRRRGHRFKAEQAAIDSWLKAIVEAAAKDLGFAAEVAALAKLRKGYGATQRRSQDNFSGIMATLVEPALRGGADVMSTVSALESARKAAVADPDGKALGDILQPVQEERTAAE